MPNSIKKKQFHQLIGIESSNLKNICSNSEGSIDKRQVVQFLLIPLWNNRNGLKTGLNNSIHQNQKSFLGLHPRPREWPGRGPKEENKHTALQSQAVTARTAMSMKRNLTKANFNASNKQSNFFLIGSVPFPGQKIFGLSNLKSQKIFGFLDYKPGNNSHRVFNTSEFDKTSLTVSLDTLTYVSVHKRSANALLLQSAKVQKNEWPCMEGNNNSMQPQGNLWRMGSKNPTFLAYWLLPFLGLLPLLSSDKNNAFISNLAQPQTPILKVSQNHRGFSSGLHPRPRVWPGRGPEGDCDNSTFISQQNFSGNAGSTMQAPIVKTNLIECYLNETYGLNQGCLIMDNHLDLTTRVNIFENLQMKLPAYIAARKPESLGQVQRQAKLSLSKKNFLLNLSNIKELQKSSKLEKRNKMTVFKTNSYALKTSNLLSNALNPTCFSNTNSDTTSIHSAKHFTPEMVAAAKSKATMQERNQVVPSQLQKKFNFLFLSQLKDLNWACMIDNDNAGARKPFTRVSQVNSIVKQDGPAGSVPTMQVQPNIFSHFLSETGAEPLECQKKNLVCAYNKKLDSTFKLLLLNKIDSLNLTYFMKGNWLARTTSSGYIVANDPAAKKMQETSFSLTLQTKPILTATYSTSKSELSLIKNKQQRVTNPKLDYLPIKLITQGKKWNVQSLKNPETLREAGSPTIQGAQRVAPLGQLTQKFNIANNNFVISHFRSYLKYFKAKLNLALTYWTPGVVGDPGASYIVASKYTKTKFKPTSEYATGILLNHKKLHFVPTLNKNLSNSYKLRYTKLREILPNNDNVFAKPVDLYTQNELTYIERKKDIQKKRKAKKLRLESRRQKKRKRFYPRPLWLRLRLALSSFPGQGQSENSFKRQIVNNTQRSFTNKWAKLSFSKTSFSIDKLVPGNAQAALSKPSMQNFHVNKTYNTIMSNLQNSSTMDALHGPLSLNSLNGEKRIKKILVGKNKANYANFESKSANSTIPKKENKNAGFIDSSIKDFWIWLYNLTDTNLKEYNRLFLNNLFTQSSVNPLAINTNEIYKVQNSSAWHGPLPHLEQDFTKLIGTEVLINPKYWGDNYGPEQTAATKGQRIPISNDMSRKAGTRIAEGLHPRPRGCMVAPDHGQTAGWPGKNENPITRLKEGNRFIQKDFSLNQLSKFSYWRKSHGNYPQEQSLKMITWAFNKTNLWSITNRRMNLWSEQKLRNQSKNNKTKFLEKQVKKYFQLAIAPQSAKNPLLFNNVFNIVYKNQPSHSAWPGPASSAPRMLGPETVSPLKMQSQRNFLGKPNLEQLPKTTLSQEHLMQGFANEKLKKRISQKMHQKEQKLSYMGSLQHNFQTSGLSNLVQPSDNNKINFPTSAWLTQTGADPSLSTNFRWWSNLPLKIDFMTDTPSIVGATSSSQAAGTLKEKSSLDISLPMTISLLFHFCALISLFSISQIRCFLKFHLILLHKLSNIYVQLLYNTALSIRKNIKNVLQSFVLLNAKNSNKVSKKSNIPFQFNWFVEALTKVTKNDILFSYSDGSYFAKNHSIFKGPGQGQAAGPNNTQKSTKFRLAEQTITENINTSNNFKKQTSKSSGLVKKSKFPQRVPLGKKIFDAFLLKMKSRDLSTNINEAAFFPSMLPGPKKAKTQIKGTDGNKSFYKLLKTKNINMGSYPGLYIPSNTLHFGKNNNHKESGSTQRKDLENVLWASASFRQGFNQPATAQGKVLKSTLGSKEKALVYTNLFKKFLTIFALVKNLEITQTSRLAINSIKKQTVNTSFKVVDTFESWLKFVYGFFEKPAEFTMDWIAYAFLVEWSSDLLAFTPHNNETLNSIVFSKYIRQNTIGLMLYNSSILKSNIPSLSIANNLSGFNQTELLKTKNMFSPPSFSPGPIYGIAFSQFLTKRLLYLNDLLFSVIYRPDTDLIYRQKKGMLFWDIWSDLLIKAADTYNINVASLSNIKEEQNLLLDNFLAKPVTLSKQNIDTSVSSLPPMKTQNETSNPASSDPRMQSQLKLEHRLNPKANKLFNPYIIGAVSSSSSIQGHFYFGLNNQSQPLGYAKLKNIKPNKLKYNSLQRVQFLMQKTNHVEAGVNTSVNNVNILENKPVQSKMVQQFVTYQSKETDLFIDYHPPKSFNYLSAIKYYTIVQQPIGSLVCQIFAGLLNKQIAKNVLVIGSTLGSNVGSGSMGFESLQKTLLIQALAGETEMKIITDNASRYAVVSRGFAIGIKYLKEVFEAITLNTPCLFLLEDIHLIGERRPLLISDHGDSAGSSGMSDLSKTAEATFGSQRNGDAVHEKNQVFYQLSRHSITNYKKPFKGDFSLTIPSNHFAFDLFLKPRPGQKTVNNTTTHPLAFQTNIFGVNQKMTDAGQTDNSQTNNASKMEGQGAGFNSKVVTSRLNLKNNGLDAFKTGRSGGIQSGSPFSVLLLKEQKKLKANKIVNELPWVGLPSEQLAILPRVSYSVRAKVSALAELGFSNMSAKLDMITDLLVIIDSVRGHRGFVVFATTHLPHILDPALRRPGRLDETISIPTLSNLWTRWEFSKYNATDRSNKAWFSSPGKAVYGHTASSTQGQIASSHKENLTLGLPFVNLFYYEKSNSSNNGTLNSFEFLNLTYRTSQKALGKTNIVSPIITGLTKLKNIRLQTSLPISQGATTVDTTQVAERNVSKLQSTVAHIAYYQIGKKIITNKYVFSLAHSTPIYLNPNLTIFKTTNVQQSTNIFTEATDAILLYGPESLKYKSMYGATRSCMVGPASPSTLQGGVVQNRVNPLKNILIGLMSGKFAEYFAFNNLPISKTKEFKQLAIFSNKGLDSSNQEQSLSYKPSIQYLYGIDQTWRAATTFALSLLQKRYLFNKNLIVPKLLNFLDYSILEEPASPPSSNILIPAKRYENSKKSLKQSIQTKLWGMGTSSLNEKLQAHTKQAYIKSIYSNKSEKKVLQNQQLGQNIEQANLLSLTANDFNKNLLLQPTSASFIYKTNLLKRHRFSLNNQWWNGQLTEHSAESLFLSDIDWRYTFIPENSKDNKKSNTNVNLAGLNPTTSETTIDRSWPGPGPELVTMQDQANLQVHVTNSSNASIQTNKLSSKDILIDFPDADQHYNPKHRRWFITSGYWDSWFNIDKQKRADILNHLILESVVYSYFILNQNRELLDYSVSKFFKKGLLK